jgi:SAM-dependent methyltransferase
MNNKLDPVASHYGIDGLVSRVLSALEQTHGNLEHLTVADLTPVDSFHIRGRAATVELAERVGISPRWRVLDVGSGPGGTARYLAAEYNCQVTGLDLTPEYVALAEHLSELVDLTKDTRFEHGNALSMPFVDENFDCVWMEHVQMNIADKNKLVLEIYRVLKAGGRLVMHEVFKGAAGEPHLPVPWSENSSTNFMVTPAEMRKTIQAQEFEIMEWKDITNDARNWFRSMQQRIAASEPPPLGIHLLMGLNAQDKITNLGRSFEEDRVKVIQAVAEKPR